ncbi:MAG: hypothetical protein LBE12_15600, partial [Planctomycetaceae bacterium]|nr:hypothetical protein [Planctomycetaceae bacterium]
KIFFQKIFFAKNGFYFSSFSYKLTEGMIQNCLPQTIGKSAVLADLPLLTNGNRKPTAYNTITKPNECDRE